MSVSSNRGYINVSLSGAADTDYVEELFYHDPLAMDSGVVYCKASAVMTLGFNAWARDTHELMAGAQIRYRWDRDHNFSNLWDTGAGALAVTPLYTAPFTLSSLTYQDGTALVAASGPKPGIVRNQATRATYLHYGVADDFGGIIHTMHAATNIRDIPREISQVEYTVTTGRSFNFCIAPPYPALKVVASGGAEFFTTPLKVYNEPKIFKQDTHIWPKSGSVDIFLKDINGGNIHYRIVTDPTDAVTAYTAVGASSVTVPHTAFAVGTSYIQYYYNSSVKAYRKIIRHATDTGFPSGGETHGNLFFGVKEDPGAEYSDLESAWLQAVSDPLDPRSTWLNAAVTGGNSTSEITLKDPFYKNPVTQVTANTTSADPGWRSKAAFDAAMVARLNDNDYTRAGSSRSFAEWARYYMTHGSMMRMDATGWEVHHEGVPQPNKIQNNRGYETVGKEEGLITLPFAYDTLIAQFRSDHHPDGITPAEDFLIRDLMGKWAFQCMQEIQGGKNNVPGMWGRNRFIAAQAMTLAMPNYDTEYYGTSGVNGTPATRYNLPFPDQALTWKDVFIDESHATPGYPNATYTTDFEGMWTQEEDAQAVDGTLIGRGAWRDKMGYIRMETSAYAYGVLAMMSALHTGKGYPAFFTGISRAKIGDLRSRTLGNNGLVAPPEYGDVHLTTNPKFPENSDEFGVYLRANSIFRYDGWRATGLFSAWTQIRYGSHAADPVAAPAAGQFEDPVTVTLPTVANTTWHYTTDGSTPTSASLLFPAEGLEIASATVLKIIGVEDGTPDSPVYQGNYNIVTLAEPRGLMPALPA